MQLLTARHIKLEVRLDFPYTECMKNKNNRTIKELVDKISEVSTARYPNDCSVKYAYVSGVLEAILDWELKGLGYSTLQDRVNESYERYEKELASLVVTA